MGSIVSRKHFERPERSAGVLPGQGPGILRVFLAATALAALLLVTAIPSLHPGSRAAAAASSKPSAGGTLVVGVQADPDGLDPHKTVAASTFEITRNIYSTLLTTDAKGRLLPDLAASWVVSQDGLSIRFNLRGNARFHNGRKVGAQDVKYSFERILAKETAHPRASDYRVIDKIEVVSQNVVVFRLKNAAPSFLSNLAMGWAAVVPEEAVEGPGGLNANPVGSGPFRFVSWVRDSQVKLRKFPDYFLDGLPYLDEVVFRTVPEPSGRTMGLRAGTLDVVTWVPPQDVASIKADPRFKITASPANGIFIMAVNNSRPPFDDVRVRKALNLAINRKAIIEGAHWGFGAEIGSHMPPVSDYYVDLAGFYPYDPEKAKALLTQAGYPNGFETVISLPQPYDFHIRNGEMIAAQLAKVGIKAKLEVVEWGTWLSKIYFGRDYSLTTIGHTGRLDPDTFLNRYAGDSKENYMNFRNPRYDQLIQDAATATDPKRRRELYAAAQKLLAEEAVAVYLMAPMTLVGMKKDVAGWEIFPVDIIDLTRVHRSKEG